MLRILMVDDHDIVRHGVLDLIAAHEGWEVCGVAADGLSAVDIAQSARPNVVILDVELPVLSGIEAARRIRASVPTTRILMFTMHDDRLAVEHALRAGAHGYVLKSDGEQRLEEAVAAIAANRPYFSPRITQMLLDVDVAEPRASVLEAFTARELEVGRLIAAGLGNKAIARQLQISVKTVESHRTAALRKAGVHTAPDFVRFAIRHNLIPL
jgi:DNA-binding NarL/FixJ family response regulator